MAATDQTCGTPREEPQLRSDESVVVAWMRSDDEQDRGDVLMARTVASVLAVSPADVLVSRLCPTCGSTAHGRPVVLRPSCTQRPFVSLARAQDLVVVAVSTGGPVGVDIEGVDAPAFSGFGAVALHERERAVTVRERAIVWTRKESLLKATGQGLRIDPRWVEMSAPADPPHLRRWDAPHPPIGIPWMATLSLDPHFVACVAVLGIEAPSLSVRPADRAGTAC